MLEVRIRPRLRVFEKFGKHWIADGGFDNLLYPQPAREGIRHGQKGNTWHLPKFFHPGRGLCGQNALVT